MSPLPRVVVVSGGVDVVGQVFVGKVHPVVDYGYVHTLSPVPLSPNPIDVYVLTPGIGEVPLAGVKGIADLRVVQ